MTDPTSVIVPIKNTLKVLVAATVVLYLALGAFAIIVYNQADTNKDALCTIRAGIEDRIETSQAFLERNPGGIPGIPAEAIKRSIDDRRATVAALSNLSC